MGCYNGFNVYRRDKDGHLIYVDELSGCVSGYSEVNDIWHIHWTGCHFLSDTTEKQIIFNEEFDGKTMADVFGPSDKFDRTKVTYEYMSVEDFTKEVMDAAEPYMRDHERIADNMRAEIEEKDAYLLDLYQRQAAIKADDEETFNRAFDRYEAHIKKAIVELAIRKATLEKWDSDDPEDGDVDMIRVREIEQMLKKLKEVHAAHPDYVIVQFCE